MLTGLRGGGRGGGLSPQPAWTEHSVPSLGFAGKALRPVPTKGDNFFCQLGSLGKCFALRKGHAQGQFQTVSFILLSPRGPPGGWGGGGRGGAGGACSGRDEPWPHSLFWMYFGEKIQLWGVGEEVGGGACTVEP